MTRTVLVPLRPLRRAYLSYRRWRIDAERSFYEGNRDWHAQEVASCAARVELLEKQLREVAYAELCLDVPTLMRPR